MQMTDANPNEAALAKLYEKRHGSMGRYEAYRKKSEQSSAALRRTRILQSRRVHPTRAADSNSE